jgi:hypothetical protein
MVGVYMRSWDDLYFFIVVFAGSWASVGIKRWRRRR